MAIDYWAHRYSSDPNLDVHEFTNPDFEADVEAMMDADDNEWEEVP